MTVATARISADEFLSGDYPIGSELIDGVVHMNGPGFRHQRICSHVFQALFRWSDGGAGGETGWGGNWVHSDAHVYKPDVWWTAEPPDGSRHEGPPYLAVEVRSPGTWHRDIGVKRDEYLRSSIKERWLVDTPASTVLVHRAGSSLDDALQLGPGEQLTGPLLPGFALTIDELFA